MGLAEIEALIDKMNTPQNIIVNIDPTGLWGVLFLWGMFVTILVSTRRFYERFSHSVVVSAFVTFVVATLFASISMISTQQLLQFLILLVLSVIYIYLEDRGVIPERI